MTDKKNDGRRGSQNARKRTRLDTPGPWTEWPETDRSERFFRFAETFLKTPKGHTAGQPIALADFQRDWVRSLFSGGVRSAVLGIPRGNGKSSLMAALAVWATFDSMAFRGGAPQVVLAAVTLRQIQLATYNVAVQMIQAEPELADRCIIYSGIGTTRVVVPSTMGEMLPIAASDPGAIQGFDPSLAIVDEVGFVSQEVWDAMTLAAGKRPDSLTVGIGTPGLDKSRSALWGLRSKFNEGAEMPGFVFTEYAADDGCDLMDEAQWRKANPAIDAGFLDIDALRMAAASSPEASFRTFRLGQWQDGVDSWLGPNGLAIWQGLKDPYALVPGAPTYCGLDVGLKHDSTAFVVMQERPDGRFHAVCKVWFPTSRETVDIADIMATIRETCLRFDVKAISFDPRLFELAAQMLSDEGLPMVQVDQSVQRMTGVIGEVFTAINSGRISHDGDEVLQTHVLNAVPRFNERGFTLQKSKSRGKIDGVIALALAFDRAQHKEKPRSPVVVL